jgi:acyl-CoA hydrolase
MTPLAATTPASSLRHELALPEQVLDYITNGMDLIAASANGEPVELLDAIVAAAAAEQRRGLTVHQMHPAEPRASMTHELKGLIEHTSYFLSTSDRPWVGHGVEYVPANFSEVPAIIASRATNPLVLATVAEHDGELYWSTNAEYAAALIRDGFPAIVEANAQMPWLPNCPIREDNILAVVHTDRPLHRTTPKPATVEDERIAEYVAERIPNGSTLQIGIGAVPDLVCRALAGRRSHLRVYTELLSDGLAHLIESGSTTVSAADPAIATFALGTETLYDFMDGNPAVRILPVDEVNAPRHIAAQPLMVAICATTEVDLYGQCASATIGGRWYSGSGGQLDFMRGVHLAPDGQGFMVLRSKLKDGSSRIKPTLAAFSAVTTGVHFVDKVVTEYGVAELHGRSLSERARNLIGVAAPEHRDELRFAARRARLI